MTRAKTKNKSSVRPVGIREGARLLGISPAHACYLAKGERKSLRVEAKMRELGIKFSV